MARASSVLAGSALRRAGSINQLFGYVFGAVYVLVGLVGFAVTRGVEFAGTEGRKFLLFELNPLHNLVHVAVGAGLAGAAAAGLAWSRRVNGVVGAVYLLVGAAGFVWAGSAADLLALNQPDNGLHLATALVALGVALRGDRFRAGPAGSLGKEDAGPPARGTDELRAGDVSPEGGTYHCSCGDFAVFVRPGGRLPACPVGKGHRYRRAQGRTGPGTRKAS